MYDSLQDKNKIVWRTAPQNTPSLLMRFQFKNCIADMKEHKKGIKENL